MVRHQTKWETAGTEQKDTLVRETARAVFSEKNKQNKDPQS